MSEIKDGGPAFPVNTGNVDNAGACFASGGMTMRDYFATKAMANYFTPVIAGTVVSENFNDPTGEYMKLAASLCYAVADAMLKAREA